MTGNQNSWLMHLLRHLSGEATRKDEQRLDALAQDDPFLADVLEGYRSVPEANHAAAVTRLKTALRRKQERRRTVAFYVLRAAAVGLVLAAAWVVFQQFQGNDTTVAERQTMMETEAAPAPSAAPEVPELQAKSLDTAFLAAEEKTQSKEIIVQKKAPRAVPPPPKNEGEKVAVETAPTAGSAARNQAAQAEEIMAFRTDTVPEIAPAADAIAADESKESAPTLQKSASPKPQAPEKDQPKTASPKAKKAWVAEPEGGFGNLEKHIQKNLRYPTAAAQNGIEGEVTLSFRFKNDGIPTDFRVEKSLGFGCDEEAERLLRTGPRWKFTAGARVNYTVVFKR